MHIKMASFALLIVWACFVVSWSAHASSFETQLYERNRWLLFAPKRPLPNSGANGVLVVLWRKSSHLSSHYPTGDAILLPLPSYFYTGCFYWLVMWTQILGLPNTPALCAASQLRGTKEVFTVMPATSGYTINA